MNVRQFFIVGCPRSGTTLLSVLLDRHSRICIPPETAFFDEVAPSLPVSSASLEKLLAKWPRLVDLDIKPDEVCVELGDLTPTTETVLSSILNIYARKSGKVHYGEKTPQHLAHAACILEAFPDAQMYCLLRDGRDVVLSLLAMPWWRPRTLADAVQLWKNSVQNMEETQAKYPVRFRTIRYEDLVNRPLSTLDTLMAEIGERFEPTQLDTDIPSRLVLRRSLPWKGQALKDIEPTCVGLRRKQAKKHVIDYLKQEMTDELLRYNYI